jgi:hypothetical protein
MQEEQLQQAQATPRNRGEASPKLKVVSPKPLDLSTGKKKLEDLRRSRASRFCPLPNGPEAQKRGLVWNGQIPNGWKGQTNPGRAKLWRQMAARGDPDVAAA